MKIKSRILSVILGLAMIAGSAVAVSANDDVAPIADTTETTPVETTAEDEADLINEEDEDVALVFVDIEGAEGNIALTSGTFAKDGTVTVADVLKAIDEADDTLEITGIDEGYITTVNGLTAGTFGGYDGWMYAVKYYTALEDGTIGMSIDVPMVGVGDYKIEDSCVIVLYYGDYGIPFAETDVDENGMINLVTYTPVYAEDYSVSDFTKAPLAEGTFTFVPVTTDEEGNEVLGEAIVFTADENGVTTLSADMKELDEGIYYGYVGKQSDKIAVGETEMTKALVVRYADIYVVVKEEVVEPEPDTTEEDKVQLLLVGMMML